MLIHVILNIYSYIFLIFLDEDEDESELNEKNKLKVNLELKLNFKKISTSVSNVFQKNERIASKLNKFVSTTITGAKTLNAVTSRVSDIMKGKKIKILNIKII
jgi:hypothetical protein